MATNKPPAARSSPCVPAWASWPSYAQVPPLFFFLPQPLLHSAAREHHAWFLSLILCLRSR
uniref:Uncharacterized protein n=1 Tax=Zea mays TaxID=4577 RepID=B6TTK4_MAIZE|nr:hypothetical protein [Zea mays]